MSAFIELKNVKKTYKMGEVEINAADGIDFEIEKGEFVGIMGKTGCGKSTLIQLIAGLLAPESGTILLDGKDINDKNIYSMTTLRHIKEYIKQNKGYLYYYFDIKIYIRSNKH